MVLSYNQIIQLITVFEYRFKNKRYLYIPFHHQYYDFMSDRKRSRDKEVAESLSILLRLIDVYQLLTIIDLFGGKKIYVPTLNELLVYVRNVTLYNEHCNGATIRELCVIYQLNEESVKKIIRIQKSLKELKAKTVKINSEIRNAVEGESSDAIAIQLRLIKTKMGILLSQPDFTPNEEGNVEIEKIIGKE